MTNETGITDAETIAALEDLVSSPGWAIFRDYARRVHGAEGIAQDLLTAAHDITDMYELGSLTSSRLSVFRAIDQLLAWPGAILEQTRKL